MIDIRVKITKDVPPVEEPEITVPETGLFTMLENDGMVATEENHQGTIIGVASILFAVLIGLLVVRAYKKNHKNFTKRSNKYSQRDFRLGGRMRQVASLSLVASILLVSGMVLINQRFGGDGESMATSNTLTLAVNDVEIEAGLAEADQIFAKPQTIRVNEATQAGYVLSVYADSADLVNTEPDSESRIKGLKTEAYERVALSPNSWGITTVMTASGAGEIWSAVPAREEAAKILKVQRDATAAEDETTVYYGVNVNNELEAGEYLGKITYVIVANPVIPDPEPQTYTIRYEANNGTDSIATQEATVGEPVTLRANTFTYEYHNFLGWGRNASDTEPVFYNQALISDGLTEQAGATVTLYAVWEEEACATIDDLEYMQDFATLSDRDKTCVIDSMADNTKYNLRDNRQYESYNIAKLKDGNVWMITNLSLYSNGYNQGLQTDLTSADTNITQTISLATVTEWNDAILGYQAGAEEPSFTEGQLDNWLNVSDKWVPSGYFNYCAMSGGEICTNSNSSDASGDLCPAGWRLPTGGSSGEFKNLYDALGSYEAMMASVEDGGADFALTGFTARKQGSGDDERWYGSLQGDNEFGYYWSSTNANATDMYMLSLTTTTANPMATGSRDSLYAVRCVLK